MTSSLTSANPWPPIIGSIVLAVGAIGGTLFFAGPAETYRDCFVVGQASGDTVPKPGRYATGYVVVMDVDTSCGDFIIVPGKGGYQSLLNGATYDITVYRGGMSIYDAVLIESPEQAE